MCVGRKRWRAERDENTCREDFTTAERHEIAARLLKQEKEAAKARQAAAGPKSVAKRKATKDDGWDESDQPSKPPKEREQKAIEKVAKAVGVGASKLRQVEAVYEAADEDPKLAPLRLLSTALPDLSQDGCDSLWIHTGTVLGREPVLLCRCTNERSVWANVCRGSIVEELVAIPPA